MTTLWVGFAGALGAMARYELDRRVRARLGDALPFGTLAVNLLGCFALALLAATVLRSGAQPATVRVALTAGFLGGFTTYSAFNQATLEQLAAGAWARAALHVALTVGGGLASGALGLTVGRALVG